MKLLFHINARPFSVLSLLLGFLLHEMYYSEWNDIERETKQKSEWKDMTRLCWGISRNDDKKQGF